MVISLIAAIDRRRVIGLGNAMPWHLPADLKHFRALTIGKPVVMGRRTYQSLGKPLGGRDNIVLSRDPEFSAAGAVVAGSVEAAIRAAGDVAELMVIGGATVYAAFLERADKMYLTEIDASVEGDTFFPEFDGRQWRRRDELFNQPDANNPLPFTFVTLLRI